jgi:hypothetical protein
MYKDMGFVLIAIITASQEVCQASPSLMQRSSLTVSVGGSNECGYSRVRGNDCVATTNRANQI